MGNTMLLSFHIWIFTLWTQVSQFCLHSLSLVKVNVSDWCAYQWKNIRREDLFLLVSMNRKLSGDGLAQSNVAVKVYSVEKTILNVAAGKRTVRTDSMLLCLINYSLHALIWVNVPLYDLLWTLFSSLSQTVLVFSCVNFFFFFFYSCSINLNLSIFSPHDVQKGFLQTFFYACLIIL